MILLPESNILHLVTMANKLGAQGKRVVGIVLPNQSTQSIHDTMWVTDNGGDRTAADKVWWEE